MIKKIHLLLWLFISASVNLLFSGNPMPVACYSFSGNANDGSGNGHNGQVYGATLTTDRFGNTNSAYLFNGKSDSIVVPNYDSIDDKNGELTICFWEKANAFKAQFAFVLAPDVRTNPSDRLGVQVEYENSGNPATIWDYGDLYSTGRLIVQPNSYSTSWKHYAFVVSAQGNFMKIYQNDTLIGTGNYHSSIINKNRSLQIGGFKPFLFEGVLDDIQIFDQALTAQEISAVYNGSGCGSTTESCNLNIPNLVACYPFSGNANDLVSGKHNGTVFGATLTSDRFGKPNSAYLFDGNADSIVVPNYASIDDSLGELSISFWEKANAFKAQFAFVLGPDIRTNPSDRLGIQVEYENKTTPAAIWDYGDLYSTGRLIAQPDPFNTNWNHFVFIVSAKSNYMAIYKNDTLIASGNQHSSIINKNRVLQIGGFKPFLFNGVLDDIAIFDRAISSYEVNMLYTSNLSPNGIASISNPSFPISVFPNPTAGNLTIQYPKDITGKVKVELYNLVGQCMITTETRLDSGTNATMEFPASAKPGMYILIVTFGNEKSVQRIVLEK